MSPPPSNLPIQLSSFIGREREIAEVKRLLSTARLVTLTGAGGSGKTRLAIEVADDWLDGFNDGVWFVDLAPLSDPSLVPQRLAATLEVQEQSQQPLLQTLTNYLQGKHSLLVLDNCEHLIEACAQLTDTLLRACPHLRMLTTSREPLNITGELTFRVPSLSSPDPQHLPTIESLSRYEAVQLFAERAQAAQSHFALTAHNALTVVQICQRLDGIPLAIELAAARVRSLPVEQIAAHLDDSFRLLTGGSRVALPRQQTLRALIDWSYDLLTVAERVLFRRLSVFAGGWTLEAAEYVCGFNVGTLERLNVLDLLAHLVDKSLVTLELQADDSGAVRYRLLEIIRQYARAKLLGSADLAPVQDRHREYFTQLAEQAEPKLHGPEQLIWLQRLEMEYDNFRVALECSLSDHRKDDGGSSEMGLRLAGALLWFWWERGEFAEGHRWLKETLTHSSGLMRTRARAKALKAAGCMAWHQQGLLTARAQLAESAAIWQELAEPDGVADARIFLAMIVITEDHLTTARVLAVESIAHFQATTDKWELALALFALGRAKYRSGEYTAARAHHAESLALFRELGDQWGIGLALGHLGVVARRQGDYTTARTLLEERLAVGRALESKHLIVFALVELGTVALYTHEHRHAAALFAEALALAQALDIQSYIADCLEGLAVAAGAKRQPERATRLFAAADVLCEAIAYRADYDRDMESVRAQLDEATFAKAWAEGRTMPLEQAIQEALSVANEILSPQSTALDSQHAARSPERQDTLRMHAFGRAQVYRGEQALTSADWTYARARELLFYLLSYPRRTKEQIGLALWPDASRTQLRNNFRTTLHLLRRALGRADWIIYADEQYAFNRGVPYWFDVEVFEHKLTEARRLKEQFPAQAIHHLEEAISLYQGDFLEDFSEGEWYFLRREELRRLHLEALLLLGRLLFGEERYTQATEIYRQVIARDSYLEGAHRELMRCYARQGEPSQALRHYQSLVALMREELGIEPAAETRALFERLQRGEDV